MPNPIRRAYCAATVAQVAPYLPANYLAAPYKDGCLIVGSDNCGWTLDDYVIPRLASGLYFARELSA